jgi:hypothetical protein
VSVTFSSAVTAGSTLAATWAVNGVNHAPSFNSVTDTLNNSYGPAVTNIETGISDGYGDTIALWTGIYFAANSPGGSNKVTMVYNLGQGYASDGFLTIYEIAGLSLHPEVDQTGAQTGTSFPPSFSFTPNASSTIALAAFETFNGTAGFPDVTAGAGWTLDTASFSPWVFSNSSAPGGLIYGAAASEHRILSNNSPVNVAISQSVAGNNWVGCACTLEVAGASGGGYPHWLSTQNRDTMRHR